MAENSKDDAAENGSAAAVGATGNPSNRLPCETITMPVDALERFVSSFERTARRWEYIVYPGIALVFCLMGYGFYLVYSLTYDIRMIADRFDPKMGVHMAHLTESMQTLTSSIEDMTVRVATISTNMETMNAKMDHLENMTPIAKDMAYISAQMKYLKQMEGIQTRVTTIAGEMSSMNTKIGTITADMGRMRWDMAQMNRNVSRPMNFMNSFMPW
ncbi:MAG: hypothetical protein C0606_13855 [Hyphomicrobiales bacterium]|nr:MAG: hypothetical protein C0606_13855 [Hyphomicrobiales bacterium]